MMQNPGIARVAYCRLGMDAMATASACVRLLQFFRFSFCSRFMLGICCNASELTCGSTTILKYYQGTSKAPGQALSMKTCCE